jgi:hypothetical protein
VLTAAHGCSRVLKAAHGGINGHTGAHGGTRRHTAAHGCTRVLTAAHGCSRRHKRRHKRRHTGAHGCPRGDQGAHGGTRRHTAAHGCSRVHTAAQTAAQGRTRLHTGAHGCTRLHTEAHGFSRVHTAAHRGIKRHTCAHGCSRLTSISIEIQLWVLAPSFSRSDLRQFPHQTKITPSLSPSRWSVSNGFRRGQGLASRVAILVASPSWPRSTEKERKKERKKECAGAWHEIREGQAVAPTRRGGEAPESRPRTATRSRGRDPEVARGACGGLLGLRRSSRPRILSLRGRAAAATAGAKPGRRDPARRGSRRLRNFLNIAVMW